MKKYLITFLFLTVLKTGFCIKVGYEYSGRFTPALKKEKVVTAKLIGEIMPEFHRNFILPYKDRKLIDQLLNQQNFFIKNFLADQPTAIDYPIESYNKIFEYVSVEILSEKDNKKMSAISTSEILTKEQKNILYGVNLGSNIRIKIKLRYKNQAFVSIGCGSALIEGEYSATVVPETEAQYPGGFKQMSDFLNQNIFNKIPENTKNQNIQQAEVNFTIGEDGQIVDSKITSPSGDSNIDKIILSAINNMPKWKPAKNAQGIKVKQVFSIPFGRGC